MAEDQPEPLGLEKPPPFWRDPVKIAGIALIAMAIFEDASRRYFPSVLDLARLVVLCLGALVAVLVTMRRKKRI